jgi:hypothetical protein
MGSTFGRCCVRSCCGPGSQCCAEADPHWHMHDESILFHDEMPPERGLVDCTTIGQAHPSYALGPAGETRYYHVTDDGTTVTEIPVAPLPTMAELRAALLAERDDITTTDCDELAEALEQLAAVCVAELRRRAEACSAWLRNISEKLRRKG